MCNNVGVFRPSHSHMTAIGLISHMGVIGFFDWMLPGVMVRSAAEDSQYRYGRQLTNWETLSERFLLVSVEAHYLFFLRSQTKKLDHDGRRLS